MREATRYRDQDAPFPRADDPLHHRQALFASFLFLLIFGTYTTLQAYSYRHWAPPGMLDPETARLSVAISAMTLVLMAAYIAVNGLMRTEGPRRGRLYRQTTLFMLTTLMCVWLIHMHFNGSQNTVGYYNIPVTALAASWYLSWREGLFFFLLGNLGLAVIVSLEHQGLLPYAPLLLPYNDASSLFLHWQIIAGNLVSYLATAIFFFTALYFFQRRLERRDRQLLATHRILEDEVRERRAVAEGLRRSEERYAAAEAIGQFGHWEIDLVEESSVWSEGACRILGVDPSRPQGTYGAFLDLVHPADRKLLKRALQGAASGEAPIHLEYRIIRQDGDVRFIRSVAEQRFDAGGKPVRVVGMLHDVTERKRMEQELQSAQRIESLGVLAGGIAHDFRNLLTPILANLSIVRTYGKLDEELTEVLTDAENACIRANRLTDQLLTFSRGGAPVTRPGSIGRLLRDTVRFALSGSNVTCRYSLPEDLWTVEMDEAQIGQVIHNVTLNADQAMPDGGTVRVRAANVTVTTGDSLPLEAGPYVRVSISDQGIGIPERQLPKVFDPFYSTKEKGSGLGLSISFTIVKRHRGTILVESQPGVGTVFHIYLPASEKALPAEEQTRPRSLRGEGRILLIDDEQAVRRSASKLLSLLGYEVESAENGKEGLTRYVEARESGNPFRAVIMDLTIPGGMGGQEAIRRLRETDPDARVIVSSGYSDDPIMAGYRDHGFDAALVKPYTIHQLAEVVHTVVVQGSA